jgi:plastocyanin
MNKFIALLAAFTLATGCSSKSSQTQSAQQSSAAPAYFHADPATAGSISGTVHFSGPRPAPVAIDMSSDPACVTANKGKVYDDALVLGKSGQLANAVIYIKRGLEGKAFAPPSEAVTMDQRGCWFHPRVLAVETRQEVDIVNSDPVTHNIHPMAQMNREWNHTQGPGDPPMKRKFLKPEFIPVKCNIHNWMHASIAVLDTPYFTVSAPDGRFTLPNLPPGTYTLALWHEKLGAHEQQVVVPPHANAAVTFDLKPQ